MTNDMEQRQEDDDDDDDVDENKILNHKGNHGEDLSTAKQNKDTKTVKLKIPSPEKMKLVHAEYNKLKHALDNLDGNVSDLLQAQENEFFSAYKSHVKNIANDFQKLRNDMDEKELAIQNNVFVKELEKERDWYKREALHLDSTLTETKRREQILKDKVEELEQDKNWLSNQLKELMKEKKALIQAQQAAEAGTTN